ncbi:hypothetical protein RHGRI_004125 [Rhododendron griersonianum]|uniref:ARM repeat superfamily protein n=1 Tax=Rhododendron griersonianum TaxID=479676 RepID=A0AAV6L7U5_9ERIC|nr:hypothetical protein RHGRI_004125 [Rhododendron griersonianum]
MLILIKFQLSQARNVGIVIRDGHSNDIRVAETYDRPSIEECFRQGHKTRPNSSLSDQKSSAKTLLQLTKQYPQFRDLFGNEAVSKLLEPFDVPSNACLDLDLQQDIITTVFNISLPQGNKKVVAENLRVIPLLINALRTGTSKTQSNAAACTFRAIRARFEQDPHP